MCDCVRIPGNESYWDANTFKCVPALHEHVSCNHTYQCLKGMSCNATTNTCLCPFTECYDNTSNSCAPQTFNSASCLANNTCIALNLGSSCQPSIRVNSSNRILFSPAHTDGIIEIFNSYFIVTDHSNNRGN
jgi:hypothetical protein